MEKKIYELTVVMNDKKTEKEIKTLVEAALEKVGGSLAQFNFWGKKDLVRPIKKAGTVIMGYFEVELLASKVADMATRLRMNEEVMRHLLVENLVAKKTGVSAKAKKFAKVAVKKTAEAKAKAEEKVEVKETKVAKVTNKKAK